MPATDPNRIARLIGSDRHEIADAYNDQRVFAMSRVRGSRSHKDALADLAEIARQLHAAEIAAGVEIGSTRDAR